MLQIDYVCGLSATVGRHPSLFTVPVGEMRKCVHDMTLFRKVVSDLCIQSTSVLILETRGPFFKTQPPPQGRD